MDHYTIKLDGGKYTVIDHRTHMEFLRHGEAWPAADDLRHTGVVRAMLGRIEELEVAIKAVLDGELDERGVRGCSALGMSHFAASRTFSAAVWEANLRKVLEQK